MKKITLVFAFMLAVAGAAAQSMYVHKTDGNVYEFKVSDVDSINFAASTTDDYFYTVTYMPNGGEGEIMIDTVFYSDSYAVKYFAYTKEDFYLAKWNTKANGEGVDVNIGKLINSVTRNITLYAQWQECTNPEEPEWVDLGLPSGLKWMTCNVGATTPEGYGNYYAWGELEPKTTYDWTTYKWCNGSSTTLTKYCTDSSRGKVDSETILESIDDIVTVTYGGKWHIPTYDELNELKTECTWKWTTQNSVKGYLVTSKTNGNSIFLPAAGYRDISDLGSAGSDGLYWSSSLDTDSSDYAYNLYFNSDNVDWDGDYRYSGRSVRGVCP